MFMLIGIGGINLAECEIERDWNASEGLRIA